METANVGKNFHHASPFPEEGEGSLVVAWCCRYRRGGRTHKLVSYTHFDCKAEQRVLISRASMNTLDNQWCRRKEGGVVGRKRRKKKKIAAVKYL